MEEEEHISEIFVGLTRPAMVGIVPLDYFVLAIMLVLMVWIGLKTWWCLVLIPLLYAVGIALTRRDVNFMSVWLNRIRRCPPLPNRRFWGGNSYAP